ncbi:MAG: sugar ABC transporter ATP-binding protein [Fimbriimonadaceae bacterium]|nr:sugar ABC transporter ATP-binding protein [Fimbriimonadaceae bacterium]
MPFFAAQGICKRFGATVALKDVAFDVEPGEVHALVGENGSGKSTLMRVLCGETAPDAGSMSLDGSTYRPTGPQDAHRHGVALIHQELAVCAHLSVAENVCLGAEPSVRLLLSRGTMAQTARQALAQLGHGDLDVWTEVGRLPVAMRQIVEIARALAADARVVIFDEPTSSLTQSDAERLFAVVAQLRGQGKAIVYISHFLDEIERVADRVSVLRDGEKVGTFARADIGRDRMVTLMVGRAVDEMYPRSERVPGDVLLRVEDLAGASKPTRASLTVRRGEVLGIAGLTASGRTELLRAVFGLDAVRQGRVTVGAYGGPASPARRWRQGIGMLSEDRKGEGLAMNLSISDNVTLANTNRGFWVSPARMRADASTWAERLRVRCQGPDQPVGALSGGNQQKVALGRLLSYGVDLLLLDEPTRGIDVGSKAEIYALVDRLVQEGKAVVIVSGYLPELLGVCDRIAVMHRGELGPPIDARTTAEARLASMVAGE